MKPFNLFIRSLSALLVLCLAAALAACSGDELPASAGTPLPEGTYPVELTATVAAAQIRAAGKDAWDGGEQIGVRVGSGDAARTATYNITNTSGAMSPNGAENTIYWTNTAAAPIAAWYPQAAQEQVNLSDQSAGFAAVDYLRAETTGSYAAPVTLSFTHRMAKVKCKLIQGDGITNEEFAAATASLQIFGSTQASYKEGEVTAEAYGWITPCAETSPEAEALVVPLCMDGKPFIRVKVRDNYYVYTPPAGAADLAAGTAYTYTITVKKDGIEVSSVSAAWEDNKMSGSAEGPIFHVYLPEGHGQQLKYSNNVTELDGCLEVMGTQFTISYDVTEENHTMGFCIDEGTGTMERTISGDDTIDGSTYTFTCTLRSDLRLTYELFAYMAVGDYYYEDNTSSPFLDTKKKCIGVVFKLGAGSEDTPDNYPSDKLVDNRIHGYAVALEDAHSELGAWGIPGTDETSLSNEETFTDKYNGYTNTLAIQQSQDSKDKYNSTDVNQPRAEDQYWAFKVASEYKESTPDKSSGWYLPSIAQLHDIYNLPGRAERFIAAGGKDFITTMYNGRYWSATEKDNINAWHWYFNGEGAWNFSKNGLRPSYVRSVLTF